MGHLDDSNVSTRLSLFYQVFRAISYCTSIVDCSFTCLLEYSEINRVMWILSTVSGWSFVREGVSVFW